MLFFHVSNCCSHHRNVIWSPRGGEVVWETICLLEVIYKVKKKLGICPLVTSLLSMQRKTRRAFADLLPPLPKHATRTHVPTHTCTSPPITQVRDWDLVYAGGRHQQIETSTTTSPWQARPWDCTCSSSQVLRRGHTARRQVLLTFCCLGSLHRLAWNLSQALSCSWLLYITIQTPQLWSPFPRGKLYGPQEGAKMSLWSP